MYEKKRYICIDKFFHYKQDASVSKKERRIYILFMYIRLTIMWIFPNPELSSLFTLPRTYKYTHSYISRPDVG